MEISVIYPAYNEALNIRSTIARSMDALRGAFERFEIVIVNDASSDDTGRIADELAQEHPEVRVIHHQHNQGCGRSVWEGLRAARCELVVHNAMDYALDLRDLGNMTALLDSADVVVAVRDRRAGYSLYRKLTSAVNLFLLRALFDVRLRDYNFTQLYRRQVLEAVNTEGRSTAFLTPETLIRANDLGFRLREIEIEYHPRLQGEATSGRPRVVIETVCDMFRFWWKRGRCRRVQRNAGEQA